MKLFVRIKFFNQMEDELQSHQHEEQWLRDKGHQLAHKDVELAGEVLRELSLLETTWDETKQLITERYQGNHQKILLVENVHGNKEFILCNSLCFTRQEHCNTLADLLREYQILRTSINSITEGTGHLVDISSVLKDHEETRRSLAKVK